MFVLIALLIGSTLFFAALFYFTYRAYRTCERQFQGMLLNCEAFKDAYERMKGVADGYIELIEAQRQEIMMLEQDRTENLTQYPN